MKIYFSFICCFLIASASFAQQDKANEEPAIQHGMPEIFYKPESPLFIVDGLMMHKKDSIENKKLMIALDPSKIESIEVFKTSTALALYGEEGKNGVVSIVTKEFAKKSKIHKE